MEENNSNDNDIDDENEASTFYFYEFPPHPYDESNEQYMILRERIAKTETYGKNGVVMDMDLFINEEYPLYKVFTYRSLMDAYYTAEEGLERRTFMTTCLESSKCHLFVSLSFNLVLTLTSFNLVFMKLSSIGDYWEYDEYEPPTDEDTVAPTDEEELLLETYNSFMQENPTYMMINIPHEDGVFPRPFPLPCSMNNRSYVRLINNLMRTCEFYCYKSTPTITKFLERNVEYKQFEIFTFDWAFSQVREYFRLSK